MLKSRAYCCWLVLALLCMAGCEEQSGPTLEEQKHLDDLKRQSEQALIAVRPFLENQVLPVLDDENGVPSNERIKVLRERVHDRLQPASAAGGRVWKFAKKTGQVKANQWVLEEYHSTGGDLWLSIELLDAYEIIETDKEKRNVLSVVRSDFEDAAESIRRLEGSDR